MYTEYFALQEPPFSLTPDPRYLFMSERHREGLAHLLYGVRQPGGFVQLTGDIGSGKTTLCRCLIRQLPADTDVALVLNPRLSVMELLEVVCDELRISYPPHCGSNKILIDALNQRLLEIHAAGRRTVIIIDEAQNLSPDVLEQVRLLTNLETTQEKLLQIILIGQPELLSILKSRKLRQLSQRITARYHLQPLSKDETCAYIQHRLLVAGRREPLFTRKAMRLVYRLSGGVPRLVNIICDRALLGAYASDKNRVTAGIVRRAAREIRGSASFFRRFGLARVTRISGRRSGLVSWISGIIILAILLAGIAMFYFNGERSVAGGGWAGLSPDRKASSDDHAAMASEGDGPDNTRAAGNSSIFSLINSASSYRQELPDLVEVMADPSITTAASFSALYALWGADISLKSSDLGCKAGSASGFECLFQSGGWPRLRRYDLPAILELVMPDGNRRHAVLAGLKDDSAILVIGNRNYHYPVMEVNRVWEGSFILLWKPPFPVRQLTRGARGEDVQWVRQFLDDMEGTTADDGPDSPDMPDFYDEQLRKRVLEFQRKQSLIPDGLVGTETLSRMIKVMEDRNIPSLSRHVTP
jgi:general secretion pathway protein A